MNLSMSALKPASVETLSLVIFCIALTSVGIYMIAYAVENLLFAGLWLDELTSITYAHPNKSLSLVLANNFNYDVHPPLFYVLLHYWMMVFGTGELATRSFSLTCYFLTVALPFLIPSRSVKGEVRLAASVLLASHSVLILAGQEVRMYALMVLLTTAAALVSLRIADSLLEDKKLWRSDLAAFFGLCLCLCYTHYWGVLIAGALTATLMVLAYPRWHLLAMLAATGILVLSLFLLWFGPMLAARGGGTRYENFLAYIDIVESFRQIRRLAFPLTNVLGFSWTDTLEARRNLLWISSAVFISFGTLVCLGRNVRTRATVVLLGAVLATWLMVAAINQIIVLQKSNSPTGLVPIILILIVTTMLSIRPIGLGRFLFMAQMGLFLISVPFGAPLVREHWRETASKIESYDECRNGSFFAVPQTADQFHLRYYLASSPALLSPNQTEKVSAMLRDQCPALIWANHVFRYELDRLIENLIPEHVNIDVLSYPRSYVVFRKDEPAPKIPYEAVSSTTFENGARWNTDGATIIRDRYLDIELKEVTVATGFVISLDSNDIYRISFYNDNLLIGSHHFERDATVFGLSQRQVRFGDTNTSRSFNKIRIQPIEGDGFYSLGHLRLLRD